MNKQEIIAAVQSIISINREVITTYHVAVTSYKGMKKRADEIDSLDMEYFCHNQLQQARAELKKEVRNQKAMKVILKALQHGEGV